MFFKWEEPGNNHGINHGKIFTKGGFSWENQTMGKHGKSPISGALNGKIIELKAELSSKPCLMKPKGTGVGIPLGELVRLTFQEFVKKTILLLLADV